MFYEVFVVCRLLTGTRVKKIWTEKWGAEGHFLWCACFWLCSRSAHLPQVNQPHPWLPKYTLQSLRHSSLTLPHSIVANLSIQFIPVIRLDIHLGEEVWLCGWIFVLYLFCEITLMLFTFYNIFYSLVLPNINCWYIWVSSAFVKLQLFTFYLIIFLPSLSLSLTRMHWSPNHCSSSKHNFEYC